MYIYKFGLCSGSKLRDLVWQCLVDFDRSMFYCCSLVCYSAGQLLFCCCRAAGLLQLLLLLLLVLLLVCWCAAGSAAGMLGRYCCACLLSLWLAFGALPGIKYVSGVKEMRKF